ncbi:MAG: hypothetical protein ACI909_003308 [Planctomycetota bacterium]|jgi:hypothetical protein
MFGKSRVAKLRLVAGGKVGEYFSLKKSGDTRMGKHRSCEIVIDGLMYTQ